MKDLHQAMNGFEKLLGKGSVGDVYKGTIRGPQPQLVTVNQLIDTNEDTEKEFTSEVQSIEQIHHRNLVCMLGYCKEGKHHMLVFEFMLGGSLRHTLFNVQQQPPWLWHDEAALAITRWLTITLRDSYTSQLEIGHKCSPYILHATFVLL